jgi:hypothetical protein
MADSAHTTENPGMPESLAWPWLAGPWFDRGPRHLVFEKPTRDRACDHAATHSSDAA